MNRPIKQSTAGFTLIELMVALMILGMVIIVLTPRINVLLARTRYGKVAADLKILVQVATVDAGETRDYAPAAMPGDMPARFTNSLNAWPQPPCPGWTYQWENLVDVNFNGFARITVRNEADTPIFYRCVGVVGTEQQCEITGDPISGGTEINTIPERVVTCKET